MTIHVDENGEPTFKLDDKYASLLHEFRDAITVTEAARANLKKDDSWDRLKALFDAGLMMIEQDTSSHRARLVQTSPSGLRLMRSWRRDAPKRAIAAQMAARDTEARQRGYIEESLF